MLYIDWIIAAFATLAIYLALALAYAEWHDWRRRHRGNGGGAKHK